MSRWSPEPLTVTLGAASVEFARAGNARATWSCAVEARDDDVQPWQGALRALQSGLARVQAQGASALVVTLEAQWTRYCVIAWQAQFSASAARRAYVEHCFVDTYGAAARDWSVIESAGRFGAAALACAVERALLDALDATAKAQQLALHSVAPALAAQYNACLAQAPTDPFWFVLLESTRMTLLLTRQGEPRVVRVAARDTTALSALLDREWFQGDFAQASCPVYYSDTRSGPPLPPTLGRWTTHTCATRAVMAKRTLARLPARAFP